MFIIAAIILLVLNCANAIAMPSWLLVTAIVLGAIELGFYVLAIVINLLAFFGIAKAGKSMHRSMRDRR